MRSLDHIAQHFYRARDVTGLDVALEGSFTPSLSLVHSLARMVRLSAEAHAIVERFRPRQPAFVEAVLRGFDDPALPRVGAGPLSAEELTCCGASSSRPASVHQCCASSRSSTSPTSRASASPPG